MDGAEVATIRLKKHAGAALLDAEYRRRPIRQRSVGVEQALAPLRGAEVDTQPLVHGSLDRDGPACGAAGPLMPAKVACVEVQTAGCALGQGMFHFENHDYRSGTTRTGCTAKSPQFKGWHRPPICCSIESFMSESDTFGPRLRAERERRGISIETIASVTKVGGDLWDALERNDFSRWPSGIFARAFVRDYARAIGLDADEVVDEFCRLFPLGDRRASRLIHAQAQLIGHHLAYAESGGLPADGDRRSASQQPLESSALRGRLIARSLATAVDAGASLSIAAGVSALMDISFWTMAGVVTVMYYTGMTIAFGTSPGLRVVEALRQRLPSLFHVADRAHA
jgi:hypothetical protein